MTDTATVSAHVLPHRTHTQLLRLARAGLAEAADHRSPGLRYATAHLAALRAATAVLAARTPTVANGRRPLTSVWGFLAEVAPELTQWATHFAGTSSRRAAAEAGIPRAVTDADADDLLRAARDFLTVVETTLGVPTAPPGDTPGAGAGDADRLRVLLGAIDNSLRTGSYMTGGNLAFATLCDLLGVDRDRLDFTPTWAASLRDDPTGDR